MMKAQEVKALPALGEGDDPGLVGVQVQPERCQDRRHPLTGLFGPLPGVAQHDEIIGVTNQRPQIAQRRPVLVEDVQGDVGQQWRDRRTLRGSRLGV
jgi:hypothetical protein